MTEYDHVPALTEQVARWPRPLPTITIDPSVQHLDDIEEIVNSDLSTEEILGLFKLEGYDPHPAVKMKVAV
jgi:thymidylate synthase